MRYKLLLLCVCFAYTNCQDICERFPLITDFNHDDCDTAEDMYYRENQHGCFPGCIHLPVFNNVDCTVRGCPPGYMCALNDFGAFRCILNEDSCFKFYVKDTNVKYVHATWKPQCFSDETWAPKQCRGEPTNGRCFCFDAVGNRIFGQEFIYRAANMTCACSRRRSDLEKDGIVNTLHCDSMGNYEPLQCDPDQCWCVEPQTGDVRSPVVPRRMMPNLPCFNRTEIGDQYLRQCESEQYAQAVVTEEFYTHGTLFANFLPTRCRYDGRFGPIRFANGVATCIWGDGTALGSYTQTYDIDLINCNCAFDKQLFENEGLAHILTCMGNGNYNRVQTQSGQFFCVDDDGFMIGQPSQTPLQISDCNQYL